MIQFNLLPDIKLQYIHAKRRKRAVTAMSALVTLSSILILVGSFVVTNVYQKLTLSSLNKSIASDTDKLKNTPDIDKILTIQSQLRSLPGLHEKKPVTSRLFTYLSQVTPAQSTISRINVNFDDKTMELTGDADTIETVNKFVDTLKFTDYTTTANPTNTKAFSNVVLTNYNRDDKGAAYKIDVVYDELIFSGASEGIRLIVPQTITTRSEVERPAALFNSTTDPAATGTR